jgi:hypothetical protein
MISFLRELALLARTAQVLAVADHDAVAADQLYAWWAAAGLEN